MCGIVGAISSEDVTSTLIEGLERLEYRGYDSAGLAVISGDGLPKRARALGRVSALRQVVNETGLSGSQGIAHTRWATHGKPEERNAHPHMSGNDLAIVHNGIIENYAVLREELMHKGVTFNSDTDTEVVAHLLRDRLASNFTQQIDAATFANALKDLEGAYALAAILPGQARTLFLAKAGSPLVVGFGPKGAYIASDPMALAGRADRFAFLEDGDIGFLTENKLTLINKNGDAVKREIKTLKVDPQSADKGNYEHYMLKEIYEQPAALARTLEGRLTEDHIANGVLGVEAIAELQQVQHVHIIACGTSYHAGLIAAYWLERYVGVSARVEIASEYRYRQPHVSDGSLFVAISQSGETADTLAALKLAADLGYVTRLAICNVAQSSIVREADHALLTVAGPEVGVASTKAFTTQLVALLILTALLTRVAEGDEALIVDELRTLPAVIERLLSTEGAIKVMAKAIADKPNALFLGRGEYYPVAMEGALKLKEISYIHAEAYAAGELKHGPLALIDENIPVIVVAPNNDLLDKLKANMEEVRARGGALYVFGADDAGIDESDLAGFVAIPSIGTLTGPIAYTVPLQMLAYHVALLRGADIDKPRNLAKSVTVE
ncbi:MAG: glutamine--fructose-6-phosphate transaminase (isomerizing) [Alphaproteobacteria bacterium]